MRKSESRNKTSTVGFKDFSYVWNILDFDMNSKTILLLHCIAVSFRSIRLISTPASCHAPIYLQSPVLPRSMERLQHILEER
jgi:hypothetical protein